MAIAPKTSYELSSSQVSTPAEVIALFWKLAHAARPFLDTVIDLGAGDCRFSYGGNYGRYVGVEIDPARSVHAALPPSGTLSHTCAFRYDEGDFEACVGNPPYVRHHFLESPWKEQTAQRLEKELGLSLDKHCNLYIYFFCLALLKTHSRGLVGLVIPYEWVTRPSARSLREHIKSKKWSVSVYRFCKSIFPGVLTTASVSIVDKASSTGTWSYYDITKNLDVVPRNGPADSHAGVLPYSERGSVWALRGLSPGSQEIFTLTEAERVHLGLKLSDVAPCVTTLRTIPRTLKALTSTSFRKNFVEKGVRCWLIQSHRKKRSAALDAYLSSIPESARNTYTCLNQEPWFNYTPHPVPQLLVAAAFTHFGPKVLINSVGAHAVGSVLGIHSLQSLPVRKIQEHLRGIDFECQVISHAKTLKKLEVKQLNAVLNAWMSET